MSRRAILFFAVLLGSCAPRHTCPVIDEQALARDIVNRMAGAGDERAADTGDGDSQPTPTQNALVPYDDLPCRGSRSGAVQLVVVSDFQCPFCSRFTPALDRVLSQYEGRVGLYFVNYPLPFHEHAALAAEAAVEARVQGGDEAFFAMHDKLFANQRALTEDDLVHYAIEIGLDGAAMRAALTDHRHTPTVDRDIALAEALGVTGTPTSIIGTQTIPGAVPFATLEDAIESALR